MTDTGHDLPGTFGDGTAGVDLMQGFLNLTYARKISDQFSVGASAIFALQRFEARGLDNFAPFTRTYVSTFNPATGGQMPRNLSDNGHDMSYGYGASVGLQWNPIEMFSFAAAYTTKMSMGELGDYADLFAEQGGFDMPSTWTVGVAIKPNERWAVMFDVQDIKYSDVRRGQQRHRQPVQLPDPARRHGSRGLPRRQPWRRLRLGRHDGLQAGRIVAVQRRLDVPRRLQHDRPADPEDRDDVQHPRPGRDGGPFHRRVHAQEKPAATN